MAPQTQKVALKQEGPTQVPESPPRAKKKRKEKRITQISVNNIQKKQKYMP